MPDLRTISDFVQINEVVVTSDLERLDAMLKSDLFLKGLGQYASEVSPGDFPVIADFVEADMMRYRQDIWDTPEPWPYQYFPEIIEDELGRLWKPTYELPEMEQDKYSLKFKGENSFIDWLNEIIYISYKNNNIVESMLNSKTNHEIKYKDMKFIIEDNIREFILQDFYRFIEVAFLGGLEESPIFNRIMEGYEAGGLPCGWLGPMPQDGGNDPVKAIALLHMGTSLQM